MPFSLKAEETEEPEVVETEPEVILATSVDFNLNSGDEFEVGDTKELTAVVNPTNTTEKLTWSSSNEKVATVNEDGLLTIVGHGTTTIKLESENGINTTKEIKAYEKMTGIEIVGGNKKEISIYGNNIITVKAVPEGTKDVEFVWKTISGDKEIFLNTWDQDEEYNTINLKSNQRNIKVYDEGSWKVEVSTVDNKFSTTLDLTSAYKVNEIYLYFPDVNYDGEYSGAVMYLSESNKMQIDYHIYPDEAVNKGIKFSIEDESIATIDAKGLVTAKKVGSTYIIAKSDDGNTVVKKKLQVVEKPNSITSAPKIFGGNDYNNSVYIGWDPVDGATKYNVYRSTSKKGKYTKIKTVDNIYYTDKKLTYGKTYYYKVEAANNDGKRMSNVISVKVIPSYVYVWYEDDKVSSKKIKLQWEKVDATGYEIYRSTNAKKGFKKIKTITKGKTTSYTDSKLKPNTTYYYKIKAYKTVKGKKIYGKFPNSPSQIKTAPAAPILNVANNDYDSLKVNLKKKVGGAVRYELYVSTSKKGKYTYYTELTDTTAKVINGLELGKTYYYKLRACNSNYDCGDYSSVVSKKVSLNKPSLTTKVEKKNVSLTLSSVNAADGYEIVKSTKKNGKYTSVKLADGELTTSITLKKGTYYFKARAYKLVNGKKVFSGYTGIKTIKVK